MIEQFDHIFVSCHRFRFENRRTVIAISNCYFTSFECKKFLDLHKKVDKWGGEGTGRSKPPASRTLQSRLLPLFSWLPPFCPFSIAKYYTMLHNSPYFSALPAILELPPPALSSPVPLLPPILPGSRPPPPPRQGQNQNFLTYLFLKISSISQVESGYFH